MNTLLVPRCLVFVAFLSALAFVLPLPAAESPANTTIVTVSKLCPTCGKKIVQKLEQLPQAAGASMNVEQQVIQVTAKAEQVLSPRIVWETVEEGGEQPIKLQGPNGTFTTKPQ